VAQGRPKYVVDPADPRAPPTDVWEAERAAVVAALPSNPSDVMTRYDDAIRRAEEAEAAREAERAAREAEHAERERIEARLAEALAEIERLKNR
jgi:hypothetical protein